MFRKVGDEVVLIYNPRLEDVEVGQNIRIFDPTRNRGLIVQVIEESLVDLTGILEDIVRRESIGELKVSEHAPTDYGKYKLDVRNMKFARAKIRKEIEVEGKEENLVDWTGWVPDRSSEVTTIDDGWIFNKLELGKKFCKYPVTLGETYSKKTLVASAKDFQGITIIVGKKYAGKSHLAKAILLGIIDYGAKGVVFDINDEYSAMQYNDDVYS